MSGTPVTLWHRKSKAVDGEEAFEFNHIEDGHCANDSPTPKVDVQKIMWAGATWKKQFAYLDGGKVVP